MLNDSEPQLQISTISAVALSHFSYTFEQAGTATINIDHSASFNIQRIQFLVFFAGRLPHIILQAQQYRGLPVSLSSFIPHLMKNSILSLSPQLLYSFSEDTKLVLEVIFKMPLFGTLTRNKCPSFLNSRIQTILFCLIPCL